MRYMDLAWRGSDDAATLAEYRRAAFARLDAILPKLPAAVRDFHARVDRGELHVHDAHLERAELNLPRGTAALTLLVCGGSAAPLRVRLAFRGVEMTLGEAVAWRALLRLREIECLLDEWDVDPSGAPEVRWLWWARTRRRPWPSFSPEFETALRFADAEIRYERGAAWTRTVARTSLRLR